MMKGKGKDISKIEIISKQFYLMTCIYNLVEVICMHLILFTLDGRLNRKENPNATDGV